MIRYCRDEPYFTAKRKLLSRQIKNEYIFLEYLWKKRREHDTDINKTRRIPDCKFQSNKRSLVMIHPKNTHELEYADHL